jgi:hypothetical protein
MLPISTVKRLLKSCATPPVNLAQRLDALSLAQCRLGPLALLHLPGKPAVGLFGRFPGGAGLPQEPLDLPRPLRQ